MITFICGTCTRTFELITSDDDAERNQSLALAQGFIPPGYTVVCDQCWELILHRRETRQQPAGLPITPDVLFSIAAARMSRGLMPFAVPNAPPPEFKSAKAPSTLDGLIKLLAKFKAMEPEPMTVPNPCDVGPLTYEMVRRLARPVPLKSSDIEEVEAMCPNNFKHQRMLNDIGTLKIHKRDDVAEGIFHPCRCGRR